MGLSLESVSTFIRSIPFPSHQILGPNFLSVNTRSGLAIYGAGHNMEKSDAYVTPGHLKDVALFFKQEKTAHSNRKRIWAGAFTNSR